MKETKLQQNELDIIQANNGLKLYLSGLLTKKDATPRSSLYNIPGKTRMLEPDAVLREWLKALASLESGSDYEKKVFQFDSAQLQKWGPQGGHAPISDLLEDIVYPSFSDDTSPAAFSSANWKLAKRNTIKRLHNAGCIGLSPVPYSRVVDDMRARDTLISNSGWPLFTRRSKPEVIEQAVQAAQSGEWKDYPAIALFRTYNGKTRLVWMFPMAANLVEGSFFQPLQSILMASEYDGAKRFLSPWAGFEHVRALITHEYSHGCAIAASDFSATDEHFKLSASMEVYDVLKECFQPRFRDALKESISRMHSIPLLIGPDKQIEGEHGVSSGSNWTNFIETIFDWIFSDYVRLEEIDYVHSSSGVYSGLYAIGDDMSWTVRQDSYDADFAKRLEAYGESVGHEIKAEKTTNEMDSVKSLQRLFQRGYFQQHSDLVRAVYPTVRALKSLVYPERMHKKQDWSKDMSAVRAIMILENCIDHPLYHEFVKFVADGDPYLREFARMSRSKQAQVFRESKSVPGLNVTYNQERRDSALSSFATIGILAKD